MAPNIVEIILKGVDKSSGAFKESQKSAEKLKDVLKGIASAGAGIAIVGVTVKKAFDLGREGAVIEQTAESFEFLMQKVDAAPDIMDQLTAASHGTISAFELQSSTMTLLAGASGELGTSLANATPRLMEIAKAANKLNPALGTTAFMYESIATGVKRAQPLILDNLGLTLKVGEANEAYAKSLGITVEKMTAQDKAMAILNATLEAGDTLIAQVGGTTDAATDSYDQMNVAIKESVDVIKKGLNPFLAKAAQAVNLLLTRTQKLNKVLGIHEEEVRQTAETWEEYDAEMRRAAEAAGFYITEEGVLLKGVKLTTEAVMEQSDALQWMTEAMFKASRDTEDTTGATFELLDAIDALRGGVEETAEEVDNFAEILIDTETAADKAQKANKRFLDGIDRDLASPIDNFVKDIQWFLATGGQFESAWGRIQELAKTAPEEALGMAQELLVMIEDSRVELNMTTGDEAAQNIKETLGVELWEANQMIRGTDGLQEAMAGLGDIIIDLGELERMEAITLRILQNLSLFRTAGIGVGAAGEGFPVTPSPFPGVDTGLPGPTAPATPHPGGAGQQQRAQTFNFFPSNEIDSEEMFERVVQIASEK